MQPIFFGRAGVLESSWPSVEAWASKKHLTRRQRCDYGTTANATDSSNTNFIHEDCAAISRHIRYF